MPSASTSCVVASVLSPKPVWLCGSLAVPHRNTCRYKRRFLRRADP